MASHNRKNELQPAVISGCAMGPGAQEAFLSKGLPRSGHGLFHMLFVFKGVHEVAGLSLVTFAKQNFEAIIRTLKTNNPRITD
jgi:hypothetical protein